MYTFFVIFFLNVRNALFSHCCCCYYWYWLLKQISRDLCAATCWHYWAVSGVESSDCSDVVFALPFSASFFGVPFCLMASFDCFVCDLVPFAWLAVPLSTELSDISSELDRTSPSICRKKTRENLHRLRRQKKLLPVLPVTLDVRSEKSGKSIQCGGLGGATTNYWRCSMPETWEESW